MMKKIHDPIGENKDDLEITKLIRHTPYFASLKIIPTFVLNKIFH